jgi:hypothetical protein
MPIARSTTNSPISSSVVSSPFERARSPTDIASPASLNHSSASEDLTNVGTSNGGLVLDIAATHTGSSGIGFESPTNFTTPKSGNSACPSPFLMFRPALEAAAEEQQREAMEGSYDSDDEGGPKGIDEGEDEDNDNHLHQSSDSVDSHDSSHHSNSHNHSNNSSHMSHGNGNGHSNRVAPATPPRSPTPSGLSALSPDPKAFQESKALSRKTPERLRQKAAEISAAMAARNKAPPPTPMRLKRPNRLARTSSLHDTKFLIGTHFGSSLVLHGHPSENMFHDEFTDHKLVGEGSFFQVFRCKGLDGNMYAVKKSKAAFKGKADREAYLREVRLVHSLGDHANIVKYYCAWQEQMHFFVQMENCQCNLTDYTEALRRKRQMVANGTSHSTPSSNNNGHHNNPHASLHSPHAPLPIKFLRDCVRQVAQALQRLHENPNGPIMHLDVKPANVLVVEHPVTYEVTMKLGDFGQAMLRKDWRDSVEGDSQYMAPELLKLEIQATPAADIFSLGLLTFELATDTMLPNSGEIWHDLRNGRAKQHFKQKITGSLSNLLLKMLDPLPDNRPTAAQVIAALHDIEHAHDHDHINGQHAATPSGHRRTPSAPLSSSSSSSSSSTISTTSAQQHIPSFASPAPVPVSTSTTTTTTTTTTSSNVFTSMASPAPPSHMVSSTSSSYRSGSMTARVRPSATNHSSLAVPGSNTHNHTSPSITGTSIPPATPARQRSSSSSGTAPRLLPSSHSFTIGTTPLNTSNVSSSSSIMATPLSLSSSSSPSPLSFVGHSVAGTSAISPRLRPLSAHSRPISPAAPRPFLTTSTPMNTNGNGNMTSSSFSGHMNNSLASPAPLSSGTRYHHNHSSTNGSSNMTGHYHHSNAHHSILSSPAPLSSLSTNRF